MSQQSPLTSTSARNATGICYLVGAGPGDPGLFTLKGKEVLEKADVVIYDSLVNPELLRFAPPHAEIIYAGKRSHHHTLSQQEINNLLVEKTKAGLTVVRLKGGDPFLFGRGGEEAEAIAAAGLRFEIVPGVSSAIAGPAYAGIPVTHRSFGSTLTIFTGHEDPEKADSQVDYSSLAKAPGTKVMLMGVERISQIVERLLAEGMPSQTPCALIHWASTPKQKIITSTLSDFVRDVTTAGLGSPAVVVFGEVVRLRENLAWFEKKPLFGKRIAVTRTRQQASSLLRALRDLGADAFEMPMIRIAPPKRPAQFRELVTDSHRYDWIVFTSPNGVEAFFRQFFEIYSDARCLGPAKIAAIGPATAAKVREYHFAVDLMPEKFIAEEIVAAFNQIGSIENQLFLLPRAEGARDLLPKKLAEMGAIVDEAIAYRTVPETDDPAGGVRRFQEEGADIVTFTSSSTVENFHSLGLSIPQGCLSASIGPITSKTMRDLGMRVDIEATRHDIPGLIEAIANASTATIVAKLDSSSPEPIS